jgi:hypothetical protein
VLCVSENKQRSCPCMALTDWFPQPRWGMFTARYEMYLPIKFRLSSTSQSFALAIFQSGHSSNRRLQIPHSYHCNIHLQIHAIAILKPRSKEWFHFTYFVYTSGHNLFTTACALPFRSAEISEPFNTTLVISHTYFVILLLA